MLMFALWDGILDNFTIGSCKMNNVIIMSVKKSEM